MNFLWFSLSLAALGVVFVACVLLIGKFWTSSGGGGKGGVPDRTDSPTLWDKLKQNQFVRGFGIAVFLTLVYILLLWLGYYLTAGALVRQLGTEKRWAFLLITVLGLPLIEVIWWLYKAAGVPGESKVIGRSFRTFAVFVLIFLGWWYHDQPNRLFEPESGKASFWVAEKEQKLYFFPSSSKPKVYFSPATGETLRLGTPADAEKFRKDSWLPKTVRDAKNLLHGSGISSVAQAATEENYKFPLGVNQITVPLSSDWGGWISTPPGTSWHIHSESDWIDVKFWDGSRERLVEGRSPRWFGIKRGVFQLRGESGEATVTIERR